VWRMLTRSVTRPKASARAFELWINRGYTCRSRGGGRSAADDLRARHGRQRQHAQGGGRSHLRTIPSPGELRNVTGGVDGDVGTDIESEKKLNRAVRDWSRCYFEALHG
jgi:hypothetical protein